jgi:hypothetical protein
MTKKTAAGLGRLAVLVIAVLVICVAGITCGPLGLTAKERINLLIVFGITCSSLWFLGIVSLWIWESYADLPED